jgi:ubiquitin-conjugating enzyme E2 J2
MSRLFQKRINKEISLYQKEDFKFPNLILRPNYNNLHEWYFIVYDLKDTDYESGIYYGKVDLPHEYPLKPPKFQFRTPNGRFDTNKSICTTFSNYHQDTYTSTWNVMSMMEGMISFMTEESNGIGSINSTSSQRQVIAKNSLEWNKNDKEFNKIFPDIDQLI